MDPLYAKVVAAHGARSEFAQYVRAVLMLEQDGDPAIQRVRRLSNEKTGAVGAANVKPGILHDMRIVRLSGPDLAAVSQYERTRRYTPEYRAVLAKHLRQNGGDDIAYRYLETSFKVYSLKLFRAGLQPNVAGLLAMHNQGMYSRIPAQINNGTHVPVNAETRRVMRVADAVRKV